MEVFKLKVSVCEHPLSSTCDLVVSHITIKKKALTVLSFLRFCNIKNYQTITEG